MENRLSTSYNNFSDQKNAKFCYKIEITAILYFKPLECFAGLSTCKPDEYLGVPRFSFIPEMKSGYFYRSWEDRRDIDLNLPT
jgi:hypothetical protein